MVDQHVSFVVSQHEVEVQWISISAIRSVSTSWSSVTGVSLWSTLPLEDPECLGSPLSPFSPLPDPVVVEVPSGSWLTILWNVVMSFVPHQLHLHQPFLNTGKTLHLRWGVWKSLELDLKDLFLPYSNSPDLL